MKSAASSDFETSGIAMDDSSNKAAGERRLRFNSFAAPTKWTGS